MFKRRKSSRCGTGQCVEVQADIAVRVWETGRDDSLMFGFPAWRAFTEFVKTGGAGRAH